MVAVFAVLINLNFIKFFNRKIMLILNVLFHKIFRIFINSNTVGKNLVLQDVRRRLNKEKKFLYVGFDLYCRMHLQPEIPAIIFRSIKPLLLCTTLRAQYLEYN